MRIALRVLVCGMLGACCMAVPVAGQVVTVTGDVSGPASRPAAVETPGVTAILSALDREMVLLEKSLAGKQERRIHGIRFVSGRMAGRPVVLVVSGMGKVNAAVVTTLLVEHFQPREVVFSGIAGCLDSDLGLGDIVIAERTVQHDLLTLERDSVLPMEIFSPVDGSKNPEYFPADPRLLRAARAAAKRTAEYRRVLPDRAPRIVTGLVVTGDMFVGADAKKKELQQRYKADAVEMEGAAVAQVCHQFAVPCLVIRSISDLADDAADVDVERFLNAASDNAAMLVGAIVAELGEPAVTSQPAAGVH